MNKLLNVLSICLAVLLVSCAPIPTHQSSSYKSTSASTQKPTKVVDTDYDSTVTIAHISHPSGVWLKNFPEKEWRLLSIFDKKEKSISNYILFIDTYNRKGWRFWSYASTNEGEDLEVNKISSRVIGCGSGGSCSHEEKIGIVLSESLLNNDKINVRVKSKSGDSFIIEVSKDEIEEHFSNVSKATEKYIK